MDAFHLLSVSVTPVVLISACGLVTLSLYNRLNAILARIRAFHEQKIELLENCDKYDSADQTTLLEMIDSQITQVTAKAKALQKGLYCLLSAILAFLTCCLLGIAAVLNESVGLVALGLHVLGLCLFLVGIGWAIRELTLSLTPLEEENAVLEILTAQHLARSQSNRKLRITKVA